MKMFNKFVDLVSSNIRWDYQNLSDRPGLPGVLHGRGWLYLFDDRARRKGLVIHPEWHLWSVPELWEPH